MSRLRFPSRLLSNVSGLALALPLLLGPAAGCSAGVAPHDSPQRVEAATHASERSEVASANAVTVSRPPEALPPDNDSDQAGKNVDAGGPWQPRDEDRKDPHRALEHPERLSHFYNTLAAVDDGQRTIARVVHMGASMIGADDLPAVLRERFQTRFGDGGAGLVLMQRYMPNYLHRWVNLRAEGWEHCYIAYLCMKDGRYGLGGTTFWSKGGATTTISTRKKELGHDVSIFELWYLARPGGGRLHIQIDGGKRTVVDTRADHLEDRYQRFEVESGPHRIQVRAAGHGSARTYGVLLETDGPGVVWDQFSKLGVFTKRVLAWNAEHLAGQIAHRNPNLLVFTYGGNDTRRVANGKLTKAGYVKEFAAVIAHIRQGKPEASCLVTSMTDRGKSLNFDITPKHVETIVEAQRQAADISGCAFFDTYAAMGGGGSLKKWKDARPPLAAKDLKHLNHRGRVKLGGWIYDALVAGYVAHRRTPRGSKHLGDRFGDR